MHDTEKNSIEFIRRSLAESSSAGALTCLPTFLVQHLHELRSLKFAGPGTAADLAIAYYITLGLEGDRTRMDFRGYPGMLRDLAAPPPWVEVEQEDMGDDITEERALELRPLIEQAQEQSEEELMERFMAKEACKASVIERFFDVPVSGIVSNFAVDSFRKLILLAKLLGVDAFQGIYNAVFDFDEFSVEPGAPDIFLWLPRLAPSLWFFSEVKAPGDSLRGSQKAWLHQNWELVRGHYAFTVLE